MILPVFVCLSVCEQDYSKTRAWIRMKCCVSTDVGTWTNWLTFEPDPDHSPDPGTGFTPDFAFQRVIWRSYGRISMKFKPRRTGRIDYFLSWIRILCWRYMHFSECPSSYYYSAKAAGVMWSFVLSFCHSVCEQDNSRTRWRTSTKHGRHRQGVTL